MGKAKIISGGTDGRYTIQILAHKTKAEARIDALENDIEKLRSGEDVSFDPSLLSQYNTLISLIDDYRDAIEDNRNKEENQKELINEIALEQQKLETLQDELSELQSIRDEYLTDYEEAEYSYEHDEITEDEYLFYQNRYLTAQANVIAKSSSVNSQEAVVAGLNAEKAAIKFAELDSDLETIKKKSGTFFDYDAKEPVDQLDDHVGYGETIISHMAQAFTAAINWYTDAVEQNYEDAMDKAELTEDQYPISNSMAAARTEANAAKSTRDSKQEDYDEAYVAYIRGEGTEEDMQAAEDALVLAQANYSAKLAQYNVYYDQWEDLEIQINSCVVIDTAPMKTRVDKTNTEYAVMSQDLASLTAFRDRQELKITSLEKELDRLEAAVDAAERQVDTWCADLTEDLAADTEVGTIEIKGEPDTILVHPGYDGAAVYNQTRDGQLQPPEISTAAQAFYNYALLPGWQKWKPMFRLGEITELSGNTCTVALDAALSVAQKLDVNQAESLSGVTIEYMNCHGAAFEVGDRVVVEFTDQDWSQPKVIGFEEEPQPCNVPLIALYGSAVGTDGWALYNPVADAFVPVAGYGIFSPPDATAYVSGPDAEHPLVMWLGTYVGSINKNNSFSDNIWDGYTNSEIIAYTNLTGTQISEQYSAMDMHRVTMEHVAPEIWYSKIYANPDWEHSWEITERWSINDETGEFTREAYDNHYYGDVSTESIPDPLDVPWQYFDWPYFYFDCKEGVFVVSKWAAKSVLTGSEVNEMGYVHSIASSSETYTVQCLETEQMTNGGNTTYTYQWDLDHESWDYVSEASGQRPWRPLYPVPAFYASDSATHVEEHDEASWPPDQTVYSVNHIESMSLNKDQIYSYDDPHVLYDSTASNTLTGSGTIDTSMVELSSIVENPDLVSAVSIVNEIVPQRTSVKFSCAATGGKTVTVLADNVETKITLDGNDVTAHMQSMYHELTGKTLGLTGLFAVCYNSPPEE